MVRRTATRHLHRGFAGRSQLMLEIGHEVVSHACAAHNKRSIRLGRVRQPMVGRGPLKHETRIIDASTDKRRLVRTSSHHASHARLQESRAKISCTIFLKKAARKELERRSRPREVQVRICVCFFLEGLVPRVIALMVLMCLGVGSSKQEEACWPCRGRDSVLKTRKQLFRFIHRFFQASLTRLLQTFINFTNGLPLPEVARRDPLKRRKSLSSRCRNGRTTTGAHDAGRHVVGVFVLAVWGGFRGEF